MLSGQMSNNKSYSFRGSLIQGVRSYWLVTSINSAFLLDGEKTLTFKSFIMLQPHALYPFANECCYNSGIVIVEVRQTNIEV
jgi:hypothetical protein